MSATENTRPASAPVFAIGDDVLFEGRPSKVVAVSDLPGIVTVENYAGRFMIGTSHSKLAKA